MKILLLAFCLLLPNGTSVLAFQNSDQDSKEIPPDYVIGIEDILRINVWREPELSVKEVVVRPDGKISIPLVGDIHASDLTPMQLQDAIVEKLKEYVAAPNVTVVVLKIGSRTVSIVGQVAKPGVYYMGAPITVLELLARAGGLGEYAKKKDISIVRKEGDRTFSYRFNYKDVSSGKNLKQNITLKSGDVVIVP